MGKQMMRKKGISLIVLVITIIIMIILATVVVMVIQQASMIEKSKEAVFKTNIGNLKEKYYLYRLSRYGEANPDEGAAEELANDIPKELKGYLNFVNGEIIYTGDNAKYKEWLQSQKIEYTAAINEMYAMDKEGVIDPNEKLLYFDLDISDILKKNTDNRALFYKIYPQVLQFETERMTEEQKQEMLEDAKNNGFEGNTINEFILWYWEIIKTESSDASEGQLLEINRSLILGVLQGAILITLTTPENRTVDSYVINAHTSTRTFNEVYYYGVEALSIKKNNVYTFNFNTNNSVLAVLEKALNATIKLVPGTKAININTIDPSASDAATDNLIIKEAISQKPIDEYED